MDNQECKVRPEIVNVNGAELVFFLFSINISKFSGSCNNTNNQYEKLCFPDVVKNLNLKAFNLMSRTNETRHIKWFEMCKCECRLDASICIEQRWNKAKYGCECKELIDKGFMWNSSNYGCDCDKSCDFGEYLGYENCRCWEKIFDKLVEECTETNDEIKLAKVTLAENENKHICSSCTLYIVLFSKVFLKLAIELVLLFVLQIHES